MLRLRLPAASLSSLRAQKDVHPMLAAALGDAPPANVIAAVQRQEAEQQARDLQVGVTGVTGVTGAADVTDVTG